MTTDRDAAPALEAELDALYGAPLAEFITRRDALAKRLKAGGDAAEARRVKALRKPTAVAWAINRLHLESCAPARSQEGGPARSGNAGGGLAPLQEANAALRGALRESRSAAERRAAIEARRRALESVTTAVVGLLEASGTAVAPALLRRIEGTLLALAAGGAAVGAAAPTPGRLDQELEPPGFEAVQDFPAPSPPPAASEATPARAAVRRQGGTPAPAAAPGKAGTTGPARRPPANGGTASKPSPTPGAAAPAQPVAAPAPSSHSAAASGGTTARSQQPYVPARDREREAAIAAAQHAVDDSEAALERATTRAEDARARADEAEKTLERTRREVEAARRELVAARSALSERRRELDRARRGA